VSEIRSDAESIQAALKRAAAALRDADVPFVLAGSLAAWARGGPETTTDLDLIVAPDEAERALEVLQAQGMRTERPPEGWLFKAWDGDVLIDVIFNPIAVTAKDIFERSELLDVIALRLRVISLEDLLVTKLSSIDEHRLDFRSSLIIARALREKIDWPDVRKRTHHSPYARAFFALLRELDIIDSPRAAARSADGPRVHVVAP
jgi:Uncharacterised nucleotidyltransferase